MLESVSDGGKLVVFMFTCRKVMTDLAEVRLETTRKNSLLALCLVSESHYWRVEFHNVVHKC